MSLSRAEFLRSLPDAIGRSDYVVAGDMIEGHEAERNWRIELAPLPELRIGLLVLPRQRVKITVRDCSMAAGQAFLDRLALYLRRGGG